MKRVGFVVTALIGGLFLHLISQRYLSFFSRGPDVLFLMTLSCGFILGPVMGEWVGFVFGLVADSLGVHLFGFQTFLYTLGGYAAGKLRRRVDSERPGPQVVIALVGTILYSIVGALMRNIVSEAGQRASIVSLIMESILNGILMPFIFWGFSLWIDIWNLRREI